MTETGIWFVVANCPDAAIAEAIGRGALDAKLTKNVNISAPLRTMYLWEGELVANEEVQLVFKVVESALDALIAFVKARYPFTTASIIAWRIDRTTPEYGGFISGF